MPRSVMERWMGIGNAVWVWEQTQSGRRCESLLIRRRAMFSWGFMSIVARCRLYHIERVHVIGVRARATAQLRIVLGLARTMYIGLARTVYIYTPCMTVYLVISLPKYRINTVYMHRVWPYIWWLPCQKYRIYTVYERLWPTLCIIHSRVGQNRSYTV